MNSADGPRLDLKPSSSEPHRAKRAAEWCHLAAGNACSRALQAAQVSRSLERRTKCSSRNQRATRAQRERNLFCAMYCRREAHVHCARLLPYDCALCNPPARCRCTCGSLPTARAVRAPLPYSADRPGRSAATTCTAARLQH